MKKQIRTTGVALIAGGMLATVGCKKEEVTPELTTATIEYTMPAEETRHEGTWLQWPHNNRWGDHIARHEETFIGMAKALHTGERVHIIVYDATEEARVRNVLTNEGLNMSQLDFYQWKTDDFWVRDNGPIFVYDKSGKLVVENWGFNGWGNKQPFENCDKIPGKVAYAEGFKLVDLDFINEGGAVEIDGNGTLMAKKSCIKNDNRNPGRSLAEIEAIFNKYLGVTNFIWMEGYAGGDITDDHIDGTARFATVHTIVTMEADDLERDEYKIIHDATDVHGNAYNIVELPATQNNIPGIGGKGSYINFYVGNDVVLVPQFNDPNDQVANNILQGVFPGKTIVGVPAIELAIDGGGIHCVTQQQPLASR